MNLNQQERTPHVARHIAMAVLAVALSACAGMSPRERSTAIGATAGAVVGGVVTGTTTGAAVGAAVGGVIGHEKDRK